MFILNEQQIIDRQKRIADEVLYKLFPIDPYALCAGGAPRDWYFNKAATDIDVFFYAGHTIGTVESMLKHVGLNIETYNDGENLDEFYRLNPNLKCVFNLNIEGEKVQLILMTEPTFKSVVPNFPLSICKVWYKNGQTHTEKEFIRSIKYKVIVKTGELYNDSHAYIKKIADKFPRTEYHYYDNWTRALEYIVDYK